MAFIGTPLDTRNTFQSLQGKRFNGDGSTTAFTLDVAPSSTLDIEVFVGNVRQDPNSAYTLSGTTLTFTGAPPSGTNNIYVVHQAKSVGTITPGANTVGVTEINLSDGSNGQAITTDGSGTLAFSTISADADNYFATSGLSSKDLGSGLHIKASDTSASVENTAEQLVLERNSHCGLSILSSTSTTGNIHFGDSGDNNIGKITYDHADNHLFFHAEANEGLRINGSQKISTGGETAADVDSGGICIDTNANDGFSLTFKNSDVAHSVTGEAEADTYMRMAKYSATQGGGAIVAYGEGGEGIYLQGVIGSGQGSTAKSTSAGAPVIIKGTKESSNAAGAMGSNENCAVILNHTNTRFIFDAEGDFHADASSTTFDAYEDAQLVRAYDLSHGKGVIDSKFDKFVAYNHEKLAELKLVGREENGTPNHFMNVTGMQRLHNGAIWQQYEKHNQLLEAVYDLAKEAVGEEKANAILDKHEVKRLQ